MAPPAPDRRLGPARRLPKTALRIARARRSDGGRTPTWWARRRRRIPGPAQAVDLYTCGKFNGPAVHSHFHFSICRTVVRLVFIVILQSRLHSRHQKPSTDGKEFRAEAISGTFRKMDKYLQKSPRRLHRRSNCACAASHVTNVFMPTSKLPRGGSLWPYCWFIACFSPAAWQWRFVALCLAPNIYTL